MPSMVKCYLQFFFFFLEEEKNERSTSVQGVGGREQDVGVTGGEGGKKGGLTGFRAPVWGFDNSFWTAGQ